MEWWEGRSKLSRGTEYTGRAHERSLTDFGIAEQKGHTCNRGKEKRPQRLCWAGKGWGEETDTSWEES